MYMMRFYISLYGFINYSEQWWLTSSIPSRLALCNAYYTEPHWSRWNIFREGPCSPSCCIVNLINIDKWPCLRINNFQQMNQTRSLAYTSTQHDFAPMMHYVMHIADINRPIRLVRVQPLVKKQVLSLVTMRIYLYSMDSKNGKLLVR